MTTRQKPLLPGELTPVNNDLSTFALPFDASLNLVALDGSQAFTVYGATDPSIDLSMVNVRHLNNTRGFRGTWEASPSDGMGSNNMPLGVPYETGQVVIGSDDQLYRLTTSAGTTDPTTANQTDWLHISRPVDLPVASLTGATADSLPLYSTQSYTLNYVVDRGTPGTVTATTIPAGGSVSATGTTVTGSITPANSVNGTFEVVASSDVADVHSPSTVHPTVAATHVFNFTDQRRMPVITPAVLAVPSVGTITDPFTIDLTPDGSLADGFAYNIDSSGIQVGSNTVTNNSYLPTGLSSSTTLNFTFPVATGATSQPAQTLTIPVMAEVYQPFFYGAQAVAPSTTTGLTRSTTGVPGATPTSITITGTAGDPIYVLVPASTTSVTSMIGAAQVPGTLVTNNIMVAGNNGQQFVYHSYRFGALFGSSVTLNLISS